LLSSLAGSRHRDSQSGASQAIVDGLGDRAARQAAIVGVLAHFHSDFRCDDRSGSPARQGISEDRLHPTFGTEKIDAGIPACVDETPELAVA